MQVRGYLLSVLIACLVLTSPLAFSADVALVHGKVYPSPTDAPIADGTVVIHDGRIAAVGQSSSIAVPRGATLVDCKGLGITAGFWNSHVHILTPALLHADQAPGDQLSAEFQEMFTRWGFTTVFDIGSVEKNTTLLRRRVESGEVRGPRILTVGEPFWIKGGTPIYVKKFLEENHVTIPEVGSIEEAKARVDEQIRGGADGIKIFANSIEQDTVLTMPLDMAKAIVTAAHRAGKPVFAHVSNDEGIEVAVRSGADILAHITPSGNPWRTSTAARLATAHTALTPTLTLFDVEGKKAGVPADRIEEAMNQAANQLRAFSEAGGQVLFGTDIGYIPQYDTAEELRWMARAGMTYQQILASLTTNPAARFGYGAHSGRIAPGSDADLVLLDGDPEKDVAAFSRVRETMRHGQVIYAAR